MCMLQGCRVTPEMPGICRNCSLYLNTCMPVIDNGFLFGECDNDFCVYCPCYEECGEYSQEVF